MELIFFSSFHLSVLMELLPPDYSTMQMVESVEPLTLPSGAVSATLRRFLPIVQLHPERAAEGGGGLGVGHFHCVDMTVGGTEVAAVQGGHLALGLLEGRPGPVFQHSGKL